MNYDERGGPRRREKGLKSLEFGEFGELWSRYIIFEGEMPEEAEIAITEEDGWIFIWIEKEKKKMNGRGWVKW